VDISRRWVSGRSGVFPNPSFPKTSSEGHYQLFSSFSRKSVRGRVETASRVRVREVVVCCVISSSTGISAIPCLGVEVSYGPR
jgi:hypothetical protein